MPELQSLIALIFPAGASLVSAAAAVSIARCEVDCAAASIAVSKGLSGLEEKQRKNPLQEVIAQIQVSSQTTSQRILTRTKQMVNIIRKGNALKYVRKWLKSIFPRLFNKNGSNDGDEAVSVDNTIPKIHLSTA